MRKNSVYSGLAQMRVYPLVTSDQEASWQMKSRQEVQIRSYGDQLFTSPDDNNRNANEDQVWGQKDPFTLYNVFIVIMQP